MPKTVAMTQRAEHSTIMDRLALDDLITGYARAVDDGDWPGYVALFTPEGRADYRSAGGIEGGTEEVAVWLARMLGQFAMRQHLIVNRRVGLVRPDGTPPDTATIRADYLNPMRLAGPVTETGDEEATAPNYSCGGRYDFTARRTPDGWRLTEVVVHEKWRRAHLPGD